MLFNGNVANSGSNTLTTPATTRYDGSAITYSSSIKKFGSHSLSLPGSGIQFAASNNILNIGNGDFTIQMWIYVVDAANGNNTLFSTSSNIRNSDGFAVTVNSRNITFGYNNSNLNNPINANIQNNTWTHIALCRISGVTKLYVNGVGYTAPNISINYGGLGLGMALYDGGSAVDKLNGYIDDLSINRTTGIYTTNFTPPSTEPSGMPAVASGSLTSVALSAQSTPSSAKVLSKLIVNTPGGSIPANFTIECSRDNGVTWNSSTDVSVAPIAVDGSTSFVYGNVDLKNQPIGNQVKYRIGYKNSVSIVHQGTGVSWS
jgi:hypothetical protein